MNGLNIMCMKMKHLVFLDSVSFIPCSLRKLPEAFGLQVSKSWYPHYFNAEENLDYVGTIPDIAYYGASEMSESESSDFIAWYEGQKAAVFHNNACWNPTARMMSPSCGKPGKCLGGNSYRSQISRYFRNLLPSHQHATKCCANGS
jgi:hypothetical protein